MSDKSRLTLKSRQEAQIDSKSRVLSLREVIAALALAAVVMCGLWLLTATGGAVGIARADDWSYLLTQFEFAESGRFVMNNWAVTMLIGQTLLAAPITAIFGLSIAALQGMVGVLSASALAATYAVIRQVLPIGWSVFAVSTLVFSPVFGPSAVSFMTDVPALFFMSLSLLVGIWAISGPRVQWYQLVLSGLLALIAFAFRDYAIVASVAVIVVGILAHRERKTRGTLVGVMAVITLVALGLYTWRHSLTNDLSLSRWDIAYSVQLFTRGTLTVALFISPGLAAISWWQVKGSNLLKTLSLYVSAALIAGATVLIAGFELLGNVVHPFGTTWLVGGSGIRMWPLWVNRGIVVAAFVSLTLVFALAWKVWVGRATKSEYLLASQTWTRSNPAKAVVVVFPLLLLLTHSGATLVLGTWYIDRYFILVIPFLMAALLRVALDRGLLVQGLQLSIPAVTLVVFACIGIHVVDFNARFDGARWAIGENLTLQGYRPESIDAGVEWVAFHALDIGQSPEQREYSSDRNWWVERYPDQVFCVSVEARDSVSNDSSDSESQLTVSTLFGREYSLVARPGPDSCP